MAQNIPSPGGKVWKERAVRMIIERAGDMYHGVAYAYKHEFMKEYRNGKRVITKRARPENERPLLPEGTIPRIIDGETARLALEAAAINTQDAIERGITSHEKVMQENRNFVKWCQDFKKHGQENAPYKEKRDALRFLGVTVYIYKKGAP